MNQNVQEGNVSGQSVSDNVTQGTTNNNETTNWERCFKAWSKENKENTQMYYDQTFRRAKALFIVSLFVYAIGMVFLGIKLHIYCKLLKNYSQSINTDNVSLNISTALQEPELIWGLILSAIIGIVILIIASMFFHGYKQTLQELSVIYDRISANEKYILSLNTAEKISNSSIKNEMYKEITEALLKDEQKLCEGIHEKN